MGNDETNGTTKKRTRVRTVDETAKRRETIERLYREVMSDGVHYGVISEGQKPTLLKPGAELLLDHFGYSVAEIRSDEKELGDGHFEAVIYVYVDDKDGTRGGVGIGSCSTRETKYQYRNEWKNRLNPEYVAEFCDPHPRDATKVRVRENPADKANTVRKMGKKRALVDVALTATGASFLFTQDLDEPHLVGGGSSGDSVGYKPGAQRTSSPATEAADANADDGPGAGLPAEVADDFVPDTPLIAMLNAVSFATTKRGKRAGSLYARFHLSTRKSETTVSEFGDYANAIRALGLSTEGMADGVTFSADMLVSIVLERDGDYWRVQQIGKVPDRKPDPPSGGGEPGTLDLGEDCPPIESGEMSEPPRGLSLPQLEDETVANMIYHERRIRGGSFEDAYNRLTEKMRAAILKRVDEGRFAVSKENRDRVTYRHFAADWAADWLGQAREIDTSPDFPPDDLGFDMDAAARFLIKTEAGPPLEDFGSLSPGG